MRFMRFYFDFLTRGQLYTKVTDLVLCCITFYSLMVTPGRPKHLDILSAILQISKKRVCAFCWFCCESLINKARNEQYKVSNVIETG